jgi:hypothetical protein
VNTSSTDETGDPAGCAALAHLASKFAAAAETFNFDPEDGLSPR